jgi:hypothetical protein
VVKAQDKLVMGEYVEGAAGKGAKMGHGVNALSFAKSFMSGSTAWQSKNEIFDDFICELF